MYTSTPKGREATLKWFYSHRNLNIEEDITNGTKMYFRVELVDI